MDRILYTVTIVFHFVYGIYTYEIPCPQFAHWQLRASSICTDFNKYTCLLDTVNENQVENCNGPRNEIEGFKTTINRGFFDRKRCSSDRFQPITFGSNGQNNCLFQKSGCSEVGQVPYNPDENSPNFDRTCTCDYTNGFAPANISQKNKCSCVPSREDCSCFKKNCQPDEILTEDYKCVRKVQIGYDVDGTKCMKILPIEPTVNSYGHVSSISELTSIKQPNVRGNGLMASVAIVVLLLFLIAISVLVLLCEEKIDRKVQKIICRNKQKTVQTANDDGRHQVLNQIVESEIITPHLITTADEVKGQESLNTSEGSIQSVYMDTHEYLSDVNESTALTSSRNIEAIIENEHKDNQATQPFCEGSSGICNVILNKDNKYETPIRESIKSDVIETFQQDRDDKIEDSENTTMSTEQLNLRKKSLNENHAVDDKNILQEDVGIAKKYNNEEQVTQANESEVGNKTKFVEEMEVDKMNETVHDETTNKHKIKVINVDNKEVAGTETVEQEEIMSQIPTMTQGNPDNITTSSGTVEQEEIMSEIPTMTQGNPDNITISSGTVGQEEIMSEIPIMTQENPDNITISSGAYPEEGSYFDQKMVNIKRPQGATVPIEGETKPETIQNWT